jgi:hypothetical protein
MVDQGLKLRDGDAVINAEFTVDLLDPKHFRITLESSGGAAGGSEFRNHEYTRGLREILIRLSDLKVSLDDCQVMSTRTRNLPEAERRVVPSAPFTYPVKLASAVDFESLRLALTRPQPTIASSAKQKSAGNNTKRITMWFTTLGRGVSRDDIIDALSASPSVSKVRRRSDISVGVTRDAVEAALGQYRTLGSVAFHQKYGTDRAAKFVIATPDGLEFDAKAILLAARAIQGLDGANSDFRGDTHTVQEPLQRLGFIVEDITTQDTGEPDSSSVTQHAEFPGALAAAREFLGATNGKAQVIVRREQRILRRALGLTSDSGICALCGQTFPTNLLVAAHIQRRADSTEEERCDIPAIAMIACTLGCDSLFENGYLQVNEDGRVVASELALSNDSVRKTVMSQIGRQVVATDHPSFKYFESHRHKWGARLT